MLENNLNDVVSKRCQGFRHPPAAIYQAYKKMFVLTSANYKIQINHREP